MLGFGVPLAVLLGVESVAALLLLGPVSVAYPVILLARTSKTSVGTTVVGAHDMQPTSLQCNIMRQHLQ